MLNCLERGITSWALFIGRIVCVFSPGNSKIIFVFTAYKYWWKYRVVIQGLGCHLGLKETKINLNLLFLSMIDETCATTLFFCSLQRVFYQPKWSLCISYHFLCRVLNLGQFWGGFSPDVPFRVMYIFRNWIILATIRYIWNLEVGEKCVSVLTRFLFFSFPFSFF